MAQAVKSFSDDLCIYLWEVQLNGNGGYGNGEL